MSLGRALFKAGSIVTTTTILLSFQPARIAGHLLRRFVFRWLGRLLR